MGIEKRQGCWLTLVNLGTRDLVCTIYRLLITRHCSSYNARVFELMLAESTELLI